MFNLQQIADPDKSVIKTFRFVASNNAATVLDVTLEYVAPDTLNSEQDKERVRVLGTRRFNAIQDLVQEGQDLIRFYNQLLAKRVKKIVGLSPRKIAQLVAVNEEMLKDAGPLDEEIGVDLTDGTPINDEERKKFGIVASITTRGQQAEANVLYLIQANESFANFVRQTITDISFFQAAGLEAEAKN